MPTAPKNPPVSGAGSTTRSTKVSEYTLQQTYAELDAALAAEGEVCCRVIDIRAVLAIAEAQETLSVPAGEPADLRRARVILSTAEMRRSLADAEITSRQARTRVDRARSELERVNALLMHRR